MPNQMTTESQLGSSPWVDDPIAIVGMGIRLPGSVRTPQQYWEFLTNKGSGRCRVPTDRYNVDAFLGPKGKAGHTCTEYGYFLDDLDLAAADSSFWSMPPKELELLDPQQRLMMEVVYECLESSGTAAYKGKDIGCYVGVLGEDWMDIQTKDPHHSGMHRVAGYGDFAIANRVSKELGLTGPSMTIRTACSSSLMALNTACQALYAGECSSAVVGGCNLILSPRMTVTMSEYRVISPTGYCRSFDAHADGYARGEAVNAIHIKRLSSALRDGDPIRSVIRSVCLNSDGQRSPLFIPSPESHELLIRRSHQLAGITDLSQTAMIECHGTGTIVGDTLEGRAVAKVFGELGGVLIGSVKPNIGHSEGASGLSSVIKMVLALENQTIPPNINFTTPSPKIPFEKARLRVPVECEAWPQGKAERVGLNGFGIGGANGHVLLESVRSVVGSSVNGVTGDNKPSQLLVFSGTHVETVKRSITNTVDYVSTNPSRAADTSSTLACHRQRFPNRAFAVGSVGSWDVSPVHKVGAVPDLVWVFTGQGGQYPGMGQELVVNNETARDTIKHLDQVLDEINPGRSWTLHEELFRPECSSHLFKAEYSQPCSTAIQIALVDVLKSLNVRPAAVVGHSAGEIAAAYAADALTAAEAITVAYHRGQVASRVENSGNGGMMAVSLGREQVSPLLTDGVTIACENSPKSVTLSGKVTALEAVAIEIETCHPSTSIKRLRVNCAYHSAQMEGVKDDYRCRLESLHALDKPLSTPFVSSVTGKPVHSSLELGPDYWCRNLTSPVLFYSAIANILTENTLVNPAFVEVGPHSALSGSLNSIALEVVSKPIVYIPTLVRETNAYESILRTAGRLFQSNASIDLSGLCKGTVLADLPPYPWQYDGRFWSESRVSRNWRFRQHSHHDILGSKIPDGNDKEPIWRSLIYLENVPWLREYVIDGNIVFPRAGYVSMVGEAIRQLTGQTELSLRRVNFIAELNLHENSPTEIMTQFRPSRVTKNPDSDWYDFSIVSHFDGVWTEHCAGQVRGGRHFILDPATPRPGSRKVKPDVWYRALKRFGVTYGPRFSSMQQITASVTAPEAMAELHDTREEIESCYVIHPCTVDSIFQLFSVAVSEGITRKLKQLAVPTYINELYIRPPSGPIAAQAVVKSNTMNAFSGEATGFCGDELVFSLQQMRLSPPRNDRDIRGIDPHAGARLVWRPDIDEVDIASLIRPASDFSASHLIEELAMTCMIESEHQTRDIAPSLPHYAEFHKWLATQRHRAEQGVYDHVPSCRAIAAMASTERSSHIDNLYQKALETDARFVATAITRIYRHSTALFESHIDSLSLLMKDDLLTAIYGFAQLCDFSDYFRVFAHNRPWVRVLEIGAGTGGVTATILSALQGPHAERLYDSYTYTDISPGFFDAAQDRFKDFDGIEYRPLDITADPVAQGFNAGSYDLIVASNVLHATPSLQQTLANVKHLLKPDGKLFLQELAPRTKWINYIMGTLPGWWLGEPDGRPSEPYVSPDRWDSELRTAGLSGADSVIHDGHMNAHIISSVPKARVESARRVTVLCEKASPDVDLFVSTLNDRGFAADVRHLGDEWPTNQMVISLLELDSPQLHSLSPAKYLALRNMITSLDNTPMLWVTRSSQVSCSDPRYASTLGLLRTARRELAVTVATVELDTLGLKALSAAVTVAERVFSDPAHPSLDPVLEYVYARGTLMVGRFYPAAVAEELLDKDEADSQNPTAVVLQVGNGGQLETLNWKHKSRAMPTSVDDWVEVQPRAVGLTSNDLLIARGTLEGTALGAECTGVVQRVGPGVKQLRVGDRVIALTPGAFATRLVTSERLCARMARDLTWIDAATMPWAFATALYSLIDVARLKHSDTVLIHSACGGVGLAAIQVCQMIGAQIYCTVDSKEEVEYLVEQGISRERIFRSSNTAFLQDIQRSTDRQGVDVVLNSLSGELLHASWQCVAEFGTMVELGKRDLTRKGQLAIDVFESNRTFAAVDLTQVCEKRPELIQGLLRRCMHHYALGELSPLPVQGFSAEHVQRAFQYMQENTTIGTIALTFPEESSDLPVTFNPRTPRFRSDACHLIIGGLGGLGRSASSWMSLHGARHFAFFSPSAGRKEQDEFVLELRAQGCRVDLVSGDVSREEDVERLISSIGDDTPVAGVMQASMALEVTSLDSMSFDQWQAAFAPKVQGTWNIHNILLKHCRSVDYFVLFSSLSGLIGQTGHANYAAGNAFLDAFVQYRHSMRLPCSALNIGVMEDVGYVSNQPHIIDHFQATSTHTLHEQDLLDSIQLAIENSLPPLSDQEKPTGWPSYVSQGQICIGLRSTSPLDSPTNRTSWRRDPRMAIYHNLNKSKDQSSSSTTPDGGNDRLLERFLDQVKLKPEILKDQSSADLLGQEIGKALFNLMLRDHSDLDIDVPLASLGADSLLAIKLRDWCRRKLGLDVTVVDILNSGSLRKLGQTAATNMATKLAAAEDANQP
ncbi:hypothetical protein BDW59DRAFT_119720 [Aspergillus cavernicola]|uniref:Polyketide synthase n=1 Tax=Aspergillus cavernicola TaxID=176166 RepID=A0ABR4HWG8_9EURO